VVKSFLQISRIDFSKTFPPLTWYDSLLLLTALTALYNLDTIQLDVKSVFIYSSLDEELWDALPPGLGLDNKVPFLKKALYSLK